MFGLSRPALRHYAVVERVSTYRFGVLWQVHDRRDPVPEKLLLVPYKSKPWPILLEKLAAFQPSPMRLRNGQVALLIANGELDEIRRALRFDSYEAKNRLNPLHGFSTLSGTKKLKGIFIAGGVTIACVLLAIVPLKQVASAPLEKIVVSSQKPIKKCQEEFAVGGELSSGIRRLSKVTLREESFTISSMRAFGGLVQIRLRRGCDGKYFRLDAWQNVNSFEVSKVY